MLSRLARQAQHLTDLSLKELTMASKRPNITLYTAQTPNGIKISIALEELG
jgi:hypothetical protein